jgi:DNA-binding beta-propeller fold protein YncE
VKPFSHESEIDVAPDSKRIVVKNTLGDVAIYDIDLATEQVARTPRAAANRACP